MAFNRPTEANQSVGMESWGYRSNEDYYTDRHLIRSIDRYLARDANYLLNVGPMPDGRIAPSNVATLKRIGKWYQSVKEALIDIQPVSRLTSNRNVMLTRRNNTLYVHLNADPQGDSVKLHPIETLPKSAILLNDNRQLEALVELLPADHSTRKQVLRLRNLPVNKMANTVLVAKLEFDKIPASNQAQPANQKTDILEK
jgi:alpha-L-fucosidase